MAVQTKAHLLALLQEHHHQIRAFGVRRLGLFGSFVRERQRRESDVDMLVEFESGGKTFNAFMRLAFFLEALFGRRVELATPESLSPYMGPRIFCVRSNMSTVIQPYLQHILTETQYLMDQAQRLEKAAFLHDETLKRAFVRSLETLEKRSNSSQMMSNVGIAIWNGAP